MLKVYCDFCDNEIECTGNPDEHRKVVRIFTRNIQGKEVQIRFEVKIREPYHVCEECAKTAVKLVLP